MTLSAWRPLKDAPKTHVPVVVIGRVVPHMDVAVYDKADGRWHLRCGGEQLSEEGSDVIFAPIADTYELDRAVQVKVVEAFGVLLQAIVDAHSCVESLDDPHVILGAKLRKELRWAAVSGPRRAIEKFSTILHSAMGGRIPDEVP